MLLEMLLSRFPEGAPLCLCSLPNCPPLLPSAVMFASLRNSMLGPAWASRMPRVTQAIEYAPCLGRDIKSSHSRRRGVVRADGR
jgi:hypothetical protein